MTGTSSMTAAPASWYAVLGVAPTATADEIKAAFRAAALRLHPDKAAAADGSTGTTAGAAGAEYLRVAQAWEVLQEPARRAAYDGQLARAAAAADVAVNESVPLADLEADEAEGQACRAWPCRCGGTYLLLEEDAVAAAGAGGGAAELLVPCSTCSLHIRVLVPAAL